jgi:hypothetical protein
LRRESITFPEACNQQRCSPAPGNTSLNAAHAEGAFTDQEPGLVQPAALEITEHGSPALGRLAIAVLDREQLHDPDLREPMMISRPQLSGPPQARLDLDPVQMQV